MLKLFSRIDVMEYEQGLLYQRGRFMRAVGAGRHWVWRCLGQDLVTVDMRLVSVALPGQEILTQDKLPIRLTLIAQYRVRDPAAAVNKLQNYFGFLYEELQLALRALVGAKTLDDLFAEKLALAEALAAAVRPRAAEFGIELASCGLKDVILPGDVKAILAKVADAERTAKAALVAAREELAATRCQLNTAKLLQENPAILRLKELQVLTELARKPGNNTIVLGQAWPGATVK